MTSLIEQHEIFLKNGGFFETQKGFIKVTGPDRVDFLHRVMSQDIKNMSSDDARDAALLDGSGTIISFFNIYHCGQFFLIVVDRGQLESCLSGLEKLHFSEDIEIKNVSDDFRFISAQGAGTARVVKSGLGRIPTRPNEIVGIEECLISSQSDFPNSKGFHLMVKTESLPQVKETLVKEGLPSLSHELWQLLRAENGYFEFGIDVTPKNTVVEASLSSSVSRDKGCYPGQEVVERVFTYGNISKKLMGVKIFEPAQWEQTGAIHLKLLNGSEDAGYITSLHRIPWSNEVVGFGIIRKPFYRACEKLKVDGTEAHVSVIDLPNSFDIQRKSISNG